MITLLTYKESFGQPAGSPFCVKAMWLLNMSGLDWQREDLADPRQMPYQKLPVIRAENELIADSDNIRRWLEARGAEFDVGLSDVEKSTSRAFIRMAEEHMYFHIVLDRWGDDMVWPVIRDAYFDIIPRPFRKFLASGMRKTVLKGANFQGLGRFTPQERLDRIEQDLHAITTRLWHGAFLFGDQPSAADASVAAMLAAARATPGKTLLNTRIAEDEILCRYIDRAEDTMNAPLSAVASERLSA